MTIEVNGLAVGYPGLAPVLRGVDLVVPRGRIVGLVGPNGVGKTTLLETLAGMRQPMAGTVSYEGTDVTRMKATERRLSGIALVREGRRIFPSLTVEENLLVGYRPSKATSTTSRTAALDEAYALFPALRERRQLSGALLSGGEQQMLAIARATMMPAGVLLADEPFMGLSWRLTKTVAEALHAKREQGMAVLVADESERSLQEFGVQEIVRLT